MDITGKPAENDMEDCIKEMSKNHPAYTRSCDVYKKEKEILEVKHKRNVSFLETGKLLGLHVNYPS